jgi:hypothetical protein
LITEIKFGEWYEPWNLHYGPSSVLGPDIFLIALFFWFNYPNDIWLGIKLWNVLLCNFFTFSCLLSLKIDRLIFAALRLQEYWVMPSSFRMTDHTFHTQTTTNKAVLILTGSKRFPVFLKIIVFVWCFSDRVSW